jgi:hypothetical protein
MTSVMASRSLFEHCDVGDAKPVPSFDQLVSDLLARAEQCVGGGQDVIRAQRREQRPDVLGCCRTVVGKGDSLHQRAQLEAVETLAGCRLDPTDLLRLR